LVRTRTDTRGERRQTWPHLSAAGRVMFASATPWTRACPCRDAVDKRATQPSIPLRRLGLRWL